MSTLAQLRERVGQMLADAGYAIFTAAMIDEAIRQALDQYNAANPLTAETAITLPGAGREIALDGLEGLVEVTEVWWPYDSGAAQETWPPNRVRGFRLWWDDARPVLFLDVAKGGQPRQNDGLRLWYTRRHTIQDLDGADCTTLLPEHESLLVLGAAGHAALSRTVDLIETAGTDLYAVGLLGTWGKGKLRDFHAALRALQERRARSGLPWGPGWQLDRWER